MFRQTLAQIKNLSYKLLFDIILDSSIVIFTFILMSNKYLVNSIVIAIDIPIHPTVTVAAFV